MIFKSSRFVVEMSDDMIQSVVDREVDRV